MAKQKYDYDLIVIGSGAGGSIAADIIAAQKKRVAIIEHDTLGGECPNWGCIPTKALLYAAHIYDQAKNAGPALGLRSGALSYNYPSVKAWKDLAVQRTGAANGTRYYQSKGISVFRGNARFISPHEISVERRHLSAEHFLIATGSTWTVPNIQGLSSVPYLNARTALELMRPPKSVFILGGGAVGCEFAELFSVFGSKVYIAEATTRLLPKEDQETSELVEKIFRTKRGMDVLSHTKVLSVTKDGLGVRVNYLRGGEERSVRVEKLLIAAGKRPSLDLGLENAGVEYSDTGLEINEYLQTTAPHIYAAGDVLGRNFFTHTAVYESRVVAHNLMARQKITPDYSAVPRTTFVNPEISSVGMSEEQCLKRDLPIKIGLAPISIIGRASLEDVRDGFVKVITDKKGILIGATVVSPHAGEMIHELTLAIQHGFSAFEVANTLHAFPSWSEAIRVACAKIKV